MLQSIAVSVTMQIDEACDEKALQPFHPTNSAWVLVRHFISMGSIHNVQISLDAFCMENEFDSGDEIVERIKTAYMKNIQYQLLRIVGKLIGGLELLGNPSDVFTSIGGGVRDFFNEQRRGTTIRSPSAFAHSLGKLGGHVVGGTGVLGLGISKGLTKEFSQLSAGLAFDTQYNYKRQVALQTEARSVRQGFAIGGQLVKQGFTSGFKGVLNKPMEGARSEGAKGFAKGVGKGLVGAVFKPLSGSFAAASKAAEGISAEVKQLTGERGPQLLRIRQPRELNPQASGSSGPAILLSYPRSRTDF